MIDVEKIENEFNKYISNYDPKNERVKLKIDHIKRVAKNSKLIAESLNLTDEQVRLAMAIGFFHDIGRFEQIRIANTFSDKESKINHAGMSVKVLFEDGLIRNFIEKDKYDEIIKKAVMNHNRPKIDSGLNDEELMFSKIIRDADKLDIFYTISDEDYSIESIFWYPEFDESLISDEIIEDFYERHELFYSKIHTNSDVIAAFYAYVFDLYFPITRKLVYENKYLEKFQERVYKTFPSKDLHKQSEELLEYSLKYLK